MRADSLRLGQRREGLNSVVAYGYISNTRSRGLFVNETLGV